MIFVHIPTYELVFFFGFPDFFPTSSTHKGKKIRTHSLIISIHFPIIFVSVYI